MTTIYRKDGESLDDLREKLSGINHSPTPQWWKEMFPSAGDGSRGTAKEEERGVRSRLSELRSFYAERQGVSDDGSLTQEGGSDVEA